MKKKDYNNVIPKKNYKDLSYLQNKPKFIRWTVVAGNRELNFYESYDLILDEHDLKIRHLK